MMSPSVTGGNLQLSIVRTLEALLVLFCLAAAYRINALHPKSVKLVHPNNLVGKPAPRFVVSMLDGKQVSLEGFRGKAVLINFWATWCGNCKLEMPWLTQLRGKYAAQGFEVLGIVTDDASVTKISALTKKYGVKYPILFCNHATAQAYGGVPNLPEAFFIDRQGKIVAEMDGADSKEQIEANIRKALQR